MGLVDWWESWAVMWANNRVFPVPEGASRRTSSAWGRRWGRSQLVGLMGVEGLRECMGWFLGEGGVKW